VKLTKEDILKLSHKDRSAVEKLYRDCYAYMMSISLRYQKESQGAEDVVNRAFLKVINSIEKYDLSMSLKPWVSRITVNENIDACRKSQKMRGVINYNSEFIEMDSSFSPLEYNKAEEELDADQLRSLIHELPIMTKHVFNLFVVDGFKHQEIGEKLGISTGTSKWHLNSARKRLKVMIQKVYESEKIIHYGE